MLLALHDLNSCVMHRGSCISYTFPPEAIIAFCKSNETESPYLLFRLELILPRLPQATLLTMTVRTLCTTNHHFLYFKLKQEKGLPLLLQ